MLTPMTLSNAFNERYSSFNIEYVSVAFSFLAAIMYLWIFLNCSIVSNFCVTGHLITS